MSGGFKDYGDMSKKPERIDLLREIINDQKADFVSLIDTYKWTEIFTRDDLQKIFGYKNNFSVKLNDERLIKKGHDNGITVMTNLDVVNFSEIRMFNRNAIETKLKVKDKEIDVFSIYLDDMSEDTRLKQTKSLFEVIENRPTVFMGDLNTFDSSDEIKVPILGSALDMVFRDMSRGEVIKFIRERGFMDTNVDRLKTAPSELFPIKVGNPILRIDYIFYNQYLESGNFKVLRGEIFNKTSDHFPIMTEINCR
jgi:endonuclease/exonuclease/phosphatase family metal-dependent hydrolase